MSDIEDNIETEETTGTAEETANSQFATKMQMARMKAYRRKWGICEICGTVAMLEDGTAPEHVCVECYDSADMRENAKELKKERVKEKNKLKAELKKLQKDSQPDESVDPQKTSSESTQLPTCAETTTTTKEVHPVDSLKMNSQKLQKQVDVQSIMELKRVRNRKHIAVFMNHKECISSTGITRLKHMANTDKIEIVCDDVNLIPRILNHSSSCGYTGISIIGKDQFYNLADVPDYYDIVVISNLDSLEKELPDTIKLKTITINLIDPRFSYISNIL